MQDAPFWKRPDVGQLVLGITSTLEASLEKQEVISLLAPIVGVSPSRLCTL